VSRKPTLHGQGSLARSAGTALLAATAIATPQFVLAQEAPSDPSAENVEEIIVTGSRIRGARSAGPSVIEVSRDDIELAAPLTTTNLIQKLPQVFNLGVSENSRGQSGGSGNITYGSAINLRGLGP
jgi:iron complex outermembrane recepter protein